MNQKIDIERILEKTDLVHLAERAGAKLKKSGSGFRGACPLHGGQNPSAFHIYSGKDGRQRWHCHTDCGDGGDAVDFVRRQHHLPDDPEGFVEAMRLLAEFAGVSVTDVGLNAEQARRAQEHRQARQTRQNILAVGARYYAHLLRSPEGQKGMAYAKRRGWTEETIKQRGLGYSDGKLLSHLREQEADLKLARKVGLLSQRDDGSLVDTIPSGYLIYTHHLDEVVTYLSGRATFSDEQDKKARNLKAPKHLYWALHDHDTPLLVVEGQACAITAWQWNCNSVALCGAHLNEQNAKSIQAHSAVYLALDTDAGERIADVANELGPLTMILSGLPKKDLNDWLQAGGTQKKLADLLKKAKPWIEVAIDQARKAPVYELEDHLEDLAELVARLAPAMRSRYVREICDHHKLTTSREFQDLVDACLSNDFEIVDGRHTYAGQPLCNFAAQISRERKQNDLTYIYTLEGALDTGEKLEPVDVQANNLNAMRWIAKHWGARPIVYVPPRKFYLLRRAIQEASRVGLEKRHKQLSGENNDA